MFRVMYDMVFYFLVIIIVLNLIFGVIIDTFADLRLVLKFLIQSRNELILFF